MKACLRTEQGRRQGGWKSTRLNLGECLCRRRHSWTLDTASAAGIYSKRKRECWAEILGGGLALDCSGAAACSNPVRADPIVWSGPFDGDGAPAWSERREIVAEQSPVHLASHSSEPIAAVTHRPVSCASGGPHRRARVIKVLLLISNSTSGRVVRAQPRP